MNERVEKVELFIGGKLLPSSSHTYFDDFSCVDFSVWKLAADANSHDVNNAIISADDSWCRVYAHSKAKQRKKWLQNVADILERDKEIIAKQISIESGAPIIKAKAEVEASIAYMISAKNFVNLVDGNDSAINLNSSKLIREQVPIGVCVTITSYNNPFFSAVELSASAMALGNTVVNLSSEFTPNSSLILAKAYHEAGFPPGAYNQISASTEEVVEQLTNHPMVQAVLYSGMIAEGMYLSDLCSRQMKRILLDLDCTNTTYVMKDADIERAASEVARNGFFYQGLGKEVTNRVVCDKKIYVKFKDLLVQQAENIQKTAMGDLDDEKTWIGPCISEFHLDHISMQLEDARKKGVSILTGGIWQKNRLLPTVLESVTPEMSLFRTMTMGPIISLYPVSSMDDALSMVNDSSSDSSVSIWGAKTSNTDIFYKRATANCVYVNMLPDILKFEDAFFFEESSKIAKGIHIEELTDQKVKQVFISHK